MSSSASIGGGVVGVARRGGLGEQQVPPDEQRDQVHGVVVEAHPPGDVPGDRLAGHGVLGEPALADVVQEGGDQQHVGPRDAADEAGRLDTGLDDVPVDGEAVDGRRVRQQPDPLPLGQEAGERPGLLEGLPHRQQAVARREQADQRVTGLRRPRRREGRALPHQAGRGRRGQDDVPLGRLGRRAQQQDRIALGAGPGVEHDLPAGQRDTRRDGLQGRTTRVADRARPGQHRRHPPPGESGEVGDATADLAHVALGRRGVVEAQVGRQDVPQLGGDPVGGASGLRVEEVAEVEQRLPGALQLGAGHVDQPGRLERLEHRGVAQAALGLLDVGHRDVGELPDDLVALVHQLAQRGEPVARLAPPRGEHGGAQPQGQVGVAGQVPDVEQAQRDLEVVLAPPPPSAGTSAPSGPAGSRSPTAGTRPSRPPPPGRRPRRARGRRPGRSAGRARCGRSRPPRPARHRPRGRRSASYAARHSSSAASVRAALSGAVIVGPILLGVVRVRHWPAGTSPDGPVAGQLRGQLRRCPRCGPVRRSRPG